MQSLSQTLAGIGLVAIGGAVGASIRYAISATLIAFVPRFPLGTLVVNTLGCLIIGLLMFFTLDRPTISPNLRLFLVVGILGAMTTFSSFGYETVGLLRQGHNSAAFLNIAANVLLSLGAVWTGWQLARLLWA